MTSSKLVVEFVEEPTDAYVIKRNPAVLRCAASNARQIVFRCNGKRRRVEVEHADGLSMITLRITRSELESFFASFPFGCVCEAWSIHGNDVIKSGKATVKLAYLKGSFNQEPTGGEALIGREFKLQCTPPDGVPRPQVFWLKNGHPVSSSDKNLYMTRRGDVIIRTSDVSDGGNFTCVAHNLVGKRTSHTARVQVTNEDDNDVGSAASWSAWSSWSSCGGGSCGLNEQKRRRSCIQAAVASSNSLLPAPNSNNGGATTASGGCRGESIQRKNCIKPCTAGEWSAWSACDVKKCQQTRTRNSTSSSNINSNSNNSNHREVRYCPAKQQCNPSPVLAAGGNKKIGGVAEGTRDVMLMYGIVIATFIFILVAALLYFCKRKRNRKFQSTIAATTSSLMSTKPRNRHHQHHHQMMRSSPLVHMVTSSASSASSTSSADSVLINDKFGGGEIVGIPRPHQHQQQFHHQQQFGGHRLATGGTGAGGCYHPRDVGSNVTYWKHTDIVDDVTNNGGGNFDLEQQREALNSDNFGCYNGGHDEINQQRL